jgi:large subunit ribosomal protein L4
MPKKMRRGALRSALSERLREGNLIVIDEFGLSSPKTKEFLGAIGTLGLIENNKRAKTLIVDSLDNANLILSSRNVQKTKVTNSFGLNIYDLVYHDKLVISKAAIEELNNILDPGKEKGEAESSVEERPKAKRAAKPKAETAAAETTPAPKKRAKKEASTEEVTDNE